MLLKNIISNCYCRWYTLSVVDMSVNKYAYSRNYINNIVKDYVGKENGHIVFFLIKNKRRMELLNYEYCLKVINYNKFKIKLIK